MVLDFETAFLQWQGSGLFTVVLPFFLIFTISFAVLEKVKIFGDNKKVNAIVALILGLLVLQSDYIVYAINNFLPNISLVLIVIVMFLVVGGILFVGKDKDWKGLPAGLAALIAFVGIIWALLFDNISQQIVLPWWLYISESAKATLLIVGAIVLVIWLITGSSDKKSDGERFINKIFER